MRQHKQPKVATAALLRRSRRNGNSGFAAFYDGNSKKAGTYTFDGETWSSE
jgi:hypothetical protein